ncbi:MAG: hypothetical protein ACJA0I_001172 [Gammaproteobacteria bacterium]|jgi:hypothetical protein
MIFIKRLIFIPIFSIVFGVPAASPVATSPQLASSFK